MAKIELNDKLYTQLKTMADEQDLSIESLINTAIAEEDYLKLLNKRLRLIDMSADATITVDEDGNIIAFNTGAERLFAYDADAIIGESLSLLIPEAKRDVHAGLRQQFMEDDTSTSRYMSDRNALQGRRKDGSLIWIEIALVKHKVNDKIYTTATIRDVTELRETINTLAERDEMLRLLTNNVMDLVCLHDPDGTYRFVSPSIEAITGFTPQDLLGKNAYDFFHDDHHEDIRNVHNQHLNGINTDNIIYRFRKKDGSYIWLDTRTKPILGDNGKVRMLVTASRDITQFREAQEALRHERDLIEKFLELSPSAVNVVNRHGEIILANRRSEEILGVKRNRITERTYDAPDWEHTDYDGNPWPDEKQPFVRVMQTKAPVWDVRHAIINDDGEVIYLAINGMPILDENGEVDAVIFTIEDYTQRKRQQDELEAAFEREKKLHAMKSDFLSLVSHEFRTPLSIIKSSTGLMRMKRDSITSDEIITRTARIEKQVDTLNDMITEVTFINKAEMVGYNITPTVIDLPRFFDGIIVDLTVSYPDVNVNVEYKISYTDPFFSDAMLMSNVFRNLVSNAMKYSPDDATVTIRFDVDTEGKLSVLVSDEGIGIPANDQRNLFEVFHRASNVGSIRGTGLGLSIAKRAVDALGGDITFESEEGVGTSFVVTLNTFTLNTNSNK